MAKLLSAGFSNLV